MRLRSEKNKAQKSGLGVSEAYQLESEEGSESSRSYSAILVSRGTRFGFRRAGIEVSVWIPRSLSILCLASCLVRQTLLYVLILAAKFEYLASLVSKTKS